MRANEREKEQRAIVKLACQSAGRAASKWFPRKRASEQPIARECLRDRCEEAAAFVSSCFCCRRRSDGPGPSLTRLYLIFSNNPQLCCWSARPFCWYCCFPFRYHYYYCHCYWKDWLRERTSNGATDVWWEIGKSAASFLLLLPLLPPPPPIGLNVYVPIIARQWIFESSNGFIHSFMNCNLQHVEANRIMIHRSLS